MSEGTTGVSLRAITAETVCAVADLRVSPEQEGYVAGNAVSIAQAYFHPDAWFRGIYAADTLVGFVMLRDSTLLLPAPLSASLTLWRLMIDHRFQGGGSGREALGLVVSHARTRPGVIALCTSYVDGPHSPADFYRSFGFKPTGTTSPCGEISLGLNLKNL